MFITPQQSHEHSRNTLEMLYEYDDFMGSIDTLIDLGCGSGLDLEWWATRTTRDEKQTPLNIKCTGIDLPPALPIAKDYHNIQYWSQNFELPITIHKHKYDVVWSHDSFQHVTNPFTTLANWYNMMSEGGMLALILPQTTNLEFNRQAFDQQDYCYYNWTIVSLMHVLAVSGFDCNAGFFLKHPNDVWLHAVVYKSQHEPMDPRSTRWYHLAEKNLLPESAVKSINSHGFLRQRDLILPWLDKSLMSFHAH
jgi:ubiquinone/menaquinone biosynthesis C-methylase UbiE